jgi:hypothetical protein
MNQQKQILYFEDSDDSDDDEIEYGISGGLRPSQYVQSGNNNATHSTDGLGGGKIKVAKNLEKGLEIVAKDVYKQAKPSSSTREKKHFIKVSRIC